MFIVQSISNKSIATKKVVLRTIKLFILGLVLQGMLFFLSFGSFMTMSAQLALPSSIIIGWRVVRSIVCVNYQKAKILFSSPKSACEMKFVFRR